MNVYAGSKDVFKRLGVSNEDKMTFFLLKWIFNAIKRDSTVDDTKLQGRPYLTKQDLVKQLSKNEELLHALGYEESEIVHAVKRAPGVKDGCLLWEEFLDFFFKRQEALVLGQKARSDDEGWWRKIGLEAEQKKEDPSATADKSASP